MGERPNHVLMLYPRFVADTFWSFAESCKLMGARRSTAPLGLITVAAMLPASWEVRLIDCNTEALDEPDLAPPEWRSAYRASELACDDRPIAAAIRAGS
jgi:hypothetical protein